MVCWGNHVASELSASTGGAALRGTARVFGFCTSEKCFLTAGVHTSLLIGTVLPKQIASVSCWFDDSARKCQLHVFVFLLALEETHLLAPFCTALATKSKVQGAKLYIGRYTWMCGAFHVVDESAYHQDHQRLRLLALS